MLKFIREWLFKNVAERRSPDFVVGTPTEPYMRRWWVIPRNPILNIYLHQFMRDDDDRVLHDHPWLSLSLCLLGEMLEKSKRPTIQIVEGEWTFRTAKFAHRLLIPDCYMGKVWTLFITGPVIRNWGFHCPKGWVKWQDFCIPGAKGQIGRGCGEYG